MECICPEMKPIPEFCQNTDLMNTINIPEKSVISSSILNLFKPDEVLYPERQEKLFQSE